MTRPSQLKRGVLVHPVFAAQIERLCQAFAEADEEMQDTFLDWLGTHANRGQRHFELEMQEHRPRVLGTGTTGLSKISDS